MLAALLLGAVLVACTPAIALADTARDANWSGYVAHRAGVSFKRIDGSWIEPSARCKPGLQSFFAIWVGLGGYSVPALEQLGTDLNCGASGGASSGAWYELPPADPIRIPIEIRPGDLIHASVEASGKRVTMRLADLTRHKSFSKTATFLRGGLSSAEWIAEPPEPCNGSTCGEPTRATDFGVLHFSDDAAWATTGHGGAITNSAWGITKLIFSPPTPAVNGCAIPTSLQASSTAFEVRYSTPRSC